MIEIFYSCKYQKPLKNSRVIIKILLLLKWVSVIAWFLGEWLLYTCKLGTTSPLLKEWFGYTIPHSKLPKCDKIIGINFAHRHSRMCQRISVRLREWHIRWVSNKEVKSIRKHGRDLIDTISRGIHCPFFTGDPISHSICKKEAWAEVRWAASFQLGSSLQVHIMFFQPSGITYDRQR